MGFALVLSLILLVQTLAVVAFYAALDRIASAPPAAISATDWQQELNRADLKARQLGIGELHGLPLRYWQTVADQTRAAALAADLRTVTVVSGIQDEGSRHLDRRRKALSYLLGPDLEPRFPLEGLIVVPTAQDTLFLTLPDQELPRVVQRAATRLAEIPQPGTSSTTGLYRVRARPADDVITLRRRANVPVTDGVRLIVLDTPPQVRPGQTVPMAAYLQIDRPPQPDLAGLIPYVELVTPGAARHPIVVRGGLDGAEWRPGDLLIQQLSLTAPFDLPDGDYELQLGLDPAEDTADPPTPAVEPVRAATLRVRSE